MTKKSAEKLLQQTIHKVNTPIADSRLKLFELHRRVDELTKIVSYLLSKTK